MNINSQKKQEKTYKIPIIIIIIIISTIIIVSMIFLAYIENLINKSILSNLEEITRQDAEKLEDRIEEHTKILETIVKEIEENAKNEQDIFNIYNRHSRNNEFSRIAILYKNGTTITSDGKTVDLSEETDMFFSSSNVQLSQSRKSKINNEEINIYSKKMNFYNQEISILLVVDNYKYRNLLSQNIFQGNGIESLITKEGEIIINSKSEQNNGNIFDELKKLNSKETEKIDEMKAEILKKQEGQVFYHVKDKKHFVSYKKLRIGEWTLMIIVQEDVIAKDLIKLLEISIWIAVGIIIIITFTTIYIVISNIKKRQKLYQLAYIDPITNLGNYNSYLETIEEKVEINTKKTLIILDIDKFKTFNKKYGHIKGNELLKRVGEEIKNSVRKTDVVCRLSNDIFGVFLLGDIEVENITKRLNNKLSRIKIGDIWYNLRIAMGVYVSDLNEKDVQTMLDKAIMAHNSIKGKYNMTYGVFTEEFEQKLIRQSEIENMMEQAIKNKEFEVYYQPQISTKTKKMEGAEALVRWKKDGEMISPNEFIPIFEKNYFITKLDEYIYERVCENIKEMGKEFSKLLKFSVNVSKESLLERDFLEKYIKITNKYNVNPNNITIEITERTTVDDSINMKEILEKIKEKGFSIAIDDFGTGYSSLNILENLPIDSLKIDKTFIDKIGASNEKIEILETIFVISKKLHLTTIAEGVEKIEQVLYLKDMNCDFIQGYFYSKPLDFTAFKKYTKENQ